MFGRECRERGGNEAEYIHSLINLVALPAFRQLVTGLQPGSTVISRDTVRTLQRVSYDRLGVNDD